MVPSNSTLSLNPIRQFADWFEQAKRSRTIEDATAVCLSTLSPDGFPEGRMVLLKDYDEQGFVFYTNLHSAKGQSLKKTSRAALTFYWAPLKKQVRIQGHAGIVSPAEADLYWSSRPRLSQLGAWASQQSEVLASRTDLLKNVARFALKFGVHAIPRPPHWTGIRVVPRRIEFWQGRINRLHDRWLYVRKGKTSWSRSRLYP